MSAALTDIMALVDDLSGARDEMTKGVVASLILLRVAALTGDDVAAEMAKRRAPCAPLKVPAPHRALKGTRACEHDFIGDVSGPAPTACTRCGEHLFQPETLEQVVDEVATKLRLVPVGVEVGEGSVPWGSE